MFWKLLTLAIAAASLGATFWVYNKQTNKALSYEVLSTSPLVPLQARGFADLRLFRGDKPIERPFLATIRLVNSGDLDIRAADFEAPLEVRIIGFGSPPPTSAKMDSGLSIFQIPYKGVANVSPEVLDFRVPNTAPGQITVDASVQGSRLEIKPLLLNVGDAFTVDILINGDVRGVEVAGRIAGVKRIVELKSTPPASKDADNKRGRDLMPWAFVLVLLSVFAGVIGSFRYQKGSGLEKRVPRILIHSLVIALGAGALAITWIAVWLIGGGAWEIVIGLFGMLVVFAVTMFGLQRRD